MSRTALSAGVVRSTSMRACRQEGQKRDEDRSSGLAVVAGAPGRAAPGGLPGGLQEASLRAAEAVATPLAAESCWRQAPAGGAKSLEGGGRKGWAGGGAVGRAAEASGCSRSSTVRNILGKGKAKGHSRRGHGGRAVAGGPGGRRHTQAARWVARVHAPPRASGARRSGRSACSIMESSVAAWHNGKSSWSVVGRAGDRGRRSGAGAWTGWRSRASRALARRLGLGLPVSGAGGKSAAWHKAICASEQTSYHLDKWVERASLQASFIPSVLCSVG